ncbi:MAG: hypothetical protein V1709_09775 [Planctomycetota bacterium]
MELFSRNKTFIIISCLLFSLIFCSVTVAAEKKTAETTSTPSKTDENTITKTELSAYIHYGQMERWQEDNIQITAFTNKVEMYQAGKILMADTLITRNKNEKKAASEEKNIIFDEVYAEGNVKVISEDDVILADRFYYNFTNDTGIIINLEIRTSAKSADNTQEMEFVLKANVAYQINKKTLIAKNASVTTCPHGKPHYYLWANSISYIKNESGKHIIVYHIVPHIWGIPCFYFPYYKKTLGEEPILRSIRVAKSSIFGKIIDVKLGLNINKYLRDEKGEILKDKDGYYKKKLWGDLTLDQHFYEKRGPASEPELTYKWDSYEGFIKGYNIIDKGPDPNLKYTRLFYQTPQEIAQVTDKERGFGHIFQRYSFGQNLRADMEVYYLSDRYFLPEFFNKEYKEQKPPESYLYLRYLRDNKGIVLVGQPNSSNFQNETNYQPRLKTYLMDEPFTIAQSPSLYYSGTLELSKIRMQEDEQPNLDDSKLNRFDSFNEISSPFQVSFIRLTPFVSGRYTGYDMTKTDEDYSSRLIGSEGLRAFTQFYRSFDLKNEALGISKPVHIISLDVRYTNNSSVNTPSTDILSADNIDRYDKFGEWYFEVRNRFKSERNGTPTEFLNVGLALERYSKPISGLASNYLYPMSWLTLSPTQNDDFPQEKISNLNADLSLTPAGPLSFRTVWQYNTNSHRSEIWYFNIDMVPYPSWTISLGGNYIINRTDTYVLGLTCSPLEKWELSIAEQYDFDKQEFINRRYSMCRDLHEFFLKFVVRIDKGTGEKSYNVMISPKAVMEKITGMK